MGTGSSLRRIALALIAAANWVAAAPCNAGPPFETDDPEPTEPGHWEIYAFATTARTAFETEGEAGLDINYGLAPDVQLTAVLPISYAREDRDRLGLGDVELAVKYRFLRQREGSPLPDISFFPAVSLPTATNGMGSGRVQLFLPLWLQKDFGPWSLFGGGGLHLNPGAGNRNYWSAGIGISRAIGERLSLGAEVIHETGDEVGERARTGVNFGLTYRIDSRWSLLFSGGPGIQHSHDEGRYALYAALKLDL
jgi:hypothetical protein